MSSNKPTHSENSEVLSSFEAKLRGNYKRMFTSEPPARSTAEPSVPPAQGGTTGVLLGDIEDVTMIVQPDVQHEFNATQKTARLQQTESTEESATANDSIAEGDKEAIDGSESDGSSGGVDEYVESDGDPPGPDGWHDFPFVPSGPHGTVVLHDGDHEWLNEHKTKFPFGIRGPEGYIWAKDPEDLLWAECAPKFTTRISISQLRSLGPKPFLQVFKKGEENLEGANPVMEGPCESPQALELVCGKPTIVPSIPYAPSPWFINVRGLDDLNVYIPSDELPLTLDVFDEDDVTNPGTHDEDAPTGATFDRTVKIGIPTIQVSPDTKPIKYRLVDPTGKRTMKRKLGQAPRATLVLSESRRIGIGNSARVYEGQIGLGLDDGPVHHGQQRHAIFPPKLRVITKVSAGSAGTKYMQNEAKMYNSFPDHFFHEYTGFQLVKPSHFPRRLSQLVPYFYGYYEPDQVEIEGGQRRMPIILMEDCGTPIDAVDLTQNEKAEIVSMFDRMHNAGFVHQSVAPRNILIQPGSTELRRTFTNTPRWGRSLQTPSFRIIDFGRSRNFKEIGVNSSDIPKTGKDSEPHTFNARDSTWRKMIHTDTSQLEEAIQMRDILR